MTDVHLLLLFCVGALLQLGSLLSKRLAPARIMLVAGAVLVCLCAAAERDITLLVGQLGLACFLWFGSGGKSK